MNRRSVLKKLIITPLMLPSLSVVAQTSSGLPAHHGENGFINTDPDFAEAGFNEMAPWIAAKLGDMFTGAPKVDIPREFNSGAIFKENKPYTITWVGHATTVIQMEGKNILTDPVWSSRVGPFKWAGSPRVTEPGLSIDKLPPIDIILISHNQYDHLDDSSIEELADRFPDAKYFVPLRVRDWFEDKGIRNVEEYDWWEGGSVGELKIICAPTQHFSGRWINDRNQSLWCSWIVTGKKRLYFGGDSGYCSHFENIGRKFGPFDLTMVPIGAYEPRRLMRPVHMNPEEAVQTNLDLRGKKMLGIHWGTFMMTDEPMDEPPVKLADAVKAKNLSPDDYWALKLGETREW